MEGSEMISTRVMSTLEDEVFCLLPLRKASGVGAYSKLGKIARRGGELTRKAEMTLQGEGSSRGMRTCSEWGTAGCGWKMHGGEASV